MHPIIYKRKAFYYNSGTNPGVYPMEVNIFNIKADTIHSDYLKTSEACRTGCNLYALNGGCPPFAPDYQTLSKQYAYAMILYFKLSAKDYPRNLPADSQKNRWDFAVAFMSRALLASLVLLAEKLSGYVLSSGHCIGCRTCNFNSGENYCPRPDKRTYSLEAVGVNIVDLMKEYSDSPVIWWNDDKKHVPEYQLRVGAVLHNVLIEAGEQEALLEAVFRGSLSQTDPRV